MLPAAELRALIHISSSSFLDFLVESVVLFKGVFMKNPEYKPRPQFLFIQLALSMIFMPLVFGFLIWSALQRENAEALSPPFSLEVAGTIALALALLSFFLGSKLLSPPAKSEKEFDGKKFVSFVFRMSLCEAMAIVGFLWANSTRDLNTYFYFAGASIMLMLMHTKTIFSMKWRAQSTSKYSPQKK